MDLWKVQHPWYKEMEQYWEKYRYTYQGGQQFIRKYLKKFSKREHDEDFETRRDISFCPSFAASSINDIKNSLYQRMADIARVGGDKTYQESITGKNGGVDLHGGSMNNFIGQMTLPELLTMGRVGVYIDMPPVEGDLLSDLKGKKPYLYLYTAEQIPAWNTAYVEGEEILTHVLVHETINTQDEETGLLTGTKEQARLMRLTTEGVEIKFYENEIDKTTGNTLSVLKDVKLLKGHKRIPFVLSEITHSLLKDISDYQIALLNMESADVAYVLKANFPFYYEFFDPRAQTPFVPTTPNGDTSTEGAQALAATAKAQEIAVGPNSGRRVPIGGNAPGFIHPSAEPLKASMEKQRQMKNDMRQLINLALGTIEPKFASAESKSMDDRSLEAGLSYIGLELERVERLIAQSWAAYMNQPDKPATIKYPRKYSLKTSSDRREEADQYAELMVKAPSKQYAKEIAKLMAKGLLEQQVSDETLDKIMKEIDAADYISSDPDAIQKDLTGGLVDLVTASNARGYDGKKVVELAKEEHAERLARIQESQIAVAEATGKAKGDGNPAARGNPDASGNPKADAKEEKEKSQKGAKDTDKGPAPKDKTRGPNK